MKRRVRKGAIAQVMATTISAVSSINRGNDGQLASAVELALEGLFLARKIGKDTEGGETIYG